MPDETVTAISQSLGSVMIRTNQESLTALTSRVPAHLTYDLIKHYNDIFSDTTLQAHTDSEKRRQARPLVVAQASNYATSSASPSTTSTDSSATKKLGGIMSFMRSGGIVDDPKWSLGVFRGNGTSNQQENVSATSTSNTRHSFTPSTITHGSPPLVPQKDSTSPSPPPVTEVMFDVADHVTRKPKDGKTKSDTTSGDIDADDGHDDDDLDPFFDDD